MIRIFIYRLVFSYKTISMSEFGNELPIEGDTADKAIVEDWNGPSEEPTDMAVDAITAKLSPFLLQCIRDDINDNPYDTHQRHPSQKFMRL